MHRGTSLGTAVWLSMSLLGLGAGCTVSIQPWTRSGPGPAPPAVIRDTIPGNPFLSALQGAPSRPVSPDTGNEGMAVLLKQMRESEDQRKGMVEHAQYLKKELKDREEIMSRAALEMEQSRKDLKRIRDEMQAWQSEVDVLRERIRKLEDSRASLKPMLDQILQQLDREREPAAWRSSK